MNDLTRLISIGLLAVAIASFGCDDGTTPPATGGAGGQGGGGMMGFPEVCDGQDNDLDGREDEGNLRRACNTSCGSGVETCSGGTWSGCTAKDPETEVCDGQDNDCDGQVDEQLQRPCENDCGMGNETCRLGSWVECSAPSVAMEECDGEDNDCDGETDENLYRPCVQECSQGNEICIGGVWGNCEATVPAQEVCGDDLDNDCDGDTDEDCACTEGETRPCSNDIGACIRGAESCRPNGRWGPCVDPGGTQVTRPGELEEQCNGIDDDCNGVTDDIVQEPCGSSDVGACEFGRLRCAAGQLLCEGEVQAVGEVCNGIDDDCDGSTDEALDPDLYEENNACRFPEALGKVDRGAVEPINVTATLYPDGDTDWFRLDISEGRNVCVPFTSWGETDYEISVQLSNIPEGATYQLCVLIDRCDGGLLSDGCDDDVMQDSCEEPDLQDERCADVDDVQTLTALVEASCGRNDSTHVLAKVQALGEGPYSCSPYTLSFTSRVIEDE